MAETEAEERAVIMEEKASPTPEDKESALDKEFKPVEDEQEGEERDDSATDSPKQATHDDGEVKTTAKDATRVEEHNGASEPLDLNGTTDAPPLPDEAIPPLPNEAPPTAVEQDDGWEPLWEPTAQMHYFYNRFTGATQWDNPRVPDAPLPGPPGVTPALPAEIAPASAPAVTGYNPAVHGDYDPTAWYAQPAALEATVDQVGQPVDPAAQYAASAGFNRFTGRFQNPDLNPENFNDENKSKRQMNAFFDVDAAANSHDGRSLKAERSGKKLSKQELKQFKEKRKAKKEEKRRAWLRD